MNKHVSTVEEASDHFFKRTSNAKETTAGLRLGSVLAAAGVVSLLVAVGS